MSGDGGCGVGGAGMGMLWRSERCARSVSHLLRWRFTASDTSVVRR